MGRYGENIRERSDGRWEARVVKGCPVDRKTNYKYLYGNSYEDVCRKRIDFMMTFMPQTEEHSDQGTKQIHIPVQKELQQSIPPADTDAESVSAEWKGITIKEIAADWLKNKKASVKESTYAYYTVMVKNHIVPGLGDVSVKEVSSEMISDFLTERKKNGRITNGKPLADKTVSDLKAVIKHILSYAQAHGMIENVPFCPAFPAKQPPISVLTKSEQEKLENTLRREDNAFSLGVLLSLYGGPRIGEVCGLRWEDFDFENETVRISRTVSRIRNVDSTSGPKTKVVISSPKTECSVRTIPLPAPVFAYFRARRKEDGSLYVLTGTKKYMEPRICRSRFKHLLQRADIADHTFHTLRHTYATRCVENGVDFKSLSEMMGHSDVKITMQRYVHPSIDFKKEQINKLPCFHSEISSQDSNDPSGQEKAVKEDCRPTGFFS